jgi:putative transposase
MITRRCTQRQFLMRPDDETNNAFLYCLIEAAQRFGVDIIFTIASINHHHTGIVDRLGNYPAFLERFHRLFAKCQNALRGRTENFWSSEQTHVGLLEEENEVVASMAYALANPVKDQLVEQAEEWPGVTSLQATLHRRPLTAHRPRHFFREDGPLPHHVSLMLTRPPALEHLPSAEFADLIRENVRRIEKNAADQRALSGARAMGPKKVLSQDWRKVPNSGDSPGRGSAHNRGRSGRKTQSVLARRVFREAYARARTSFLKGFRDVVFPAGTYWLRHFAKVLCGEPPPICAEA